MEELWTAVCSGDQPAVTRYFENGGEANIRYFRFGEEHSLIMGAVRNGQVEMVRLLRSYGEEIAPYEEAEYKRQMATLRNEYYAPEKKRLSENGTGLHFNFEIQDDDSCTGKCPEYPEFEYNGKMNLDDAYYELCEWLRARPDAVKVVVAED